MKTSSKIKEKFLQDFLNTPIEVGEKVYVKGTVFSEYGSTSASMYDVIAVNGDDITIDYHRAKKTIKLTDIDTRYGTWTAGINPFDERYNAIRAVNYSLDSIAFSLDLVERRRVEDYQIKGTKIAEVNWNPFVYVKGEKTRYQRGFVWSTEQNQLLIESIYKYINCGTILVRKRGWRMLEDMQKNGETELSFADIVDGKQRLNAIRLFMRNEFTDLSGYYYDDLSDSAQHKFRNHQLFQYAEMSEDATDDEVLFQFLKMNHEGVPQSKEHLDYVSNLLTKMK